MNSENKSRLVQIKVSLEGEFQYIFPSIFKHCSNGCIEISVQCREEDIENCLNNLLTTLKNFKLKLHDISEPLHHYLFRLSSKAFTIINESFNNVFSRSLRFLSRFLRRRRT